jgi:hypothetical protein
VIPEAHRRSIMDTYGTLYAHLEGDPIRKKMGSLLGRAVFKSKKFGLRSIRNKDNNGGLGARCIRAVV